MHRGWIIAFVIVFLISAGLAYSWWSTAIRQPVDFSHALHVKNGIPCVTCHQMSASEDLPSTTRCTSCHKTMHLPAVVQWVRVYRVAPDIIFTHDKHARILCATCHQDMSSAKRIIHENRFKMDFCMDCHAQQGAKNQCGTCHKNH